MDTAGVPHVAYPAGAWPQRVLRHAQRNDDGWAITTVDTEVGSFNKVFPDIGIDASGRIHIADISQAGGSVGVDFPIRRGEADIFSMRQARAPIELR